VRLMRLLEAELENKEPDESRIYALRTPIFRSEQLYEPAGNIFVTVGITATFLGLAVGLVTLDLRALLDATSNVERARPLTAFIGCMGLALGVSMLGVITALAAQCLRGQGAAQTTESLLARAAEHSTTAAAAAQTTESPLADAAEHSKAAAMVAQAIDILLARAAEREKAAAVAQPGDLTLAADTVVSVGRRILPKAESEADAKAALRRLSGRRHRVHSAVTLIDAGGHARHRLSTSWVAFKSLSEAELEAYLASGD